MATFKSIIEQDSPLRYHRWESSVAENGGGTAATLGAISAAPSYVYDAGCVDFGIGLSFDGSNDYATLPSVAWASNKICLVWRGYFGAFSNSDLFFCESSADYNGATNGDARFVIDPDAGGGTWSIYMRGNNVSPQSYDIANYTRPSTGWHTFRVELDRSLTGNNRIKFYVDGTLQTATSNTNATGNPSDNFGTQTLYLGSRAGTSLFKAMGLDDLAVFNTIPATSASTQHSYAVDRSETLTDDFTSGPSSGSDIGARALATVRVPASTLRWTNSYGGDLVGDGSGAVRLKTSGGGASVSFVGLADGATLAALPWADAYVTFDFKITGFTNASAGVFARDVGRNHLGSSMSGYWLRYYNGNVEVYKCSGSTYTLLNQVAFTPTLGQTYTFRADITNAEKCVYINGTKYATTANNDIAASLSAGIGIHAAMYGGTVNGATTNVTIDNVRIADTAPLTVVGTPSLRRRPSGLYTR